MIVYTVREFRAKIKEAFDKANSGEVVKIVRGKDFFEVIKSLPERVHETTSKTFVPKIVDKILDEEEKPVAQFIEAGARKTSAPLAGAQQDCCKRQSMCRHWSWDIDVGAWQNVLDGALKEASN